MNASLSRADLVRLLAAPDGGLFQRTVGLLGFQAKPAREASPVLPVMPRVMVPERPVASEPVVPAPKARLRFPRLTSARYFLTEETPVSTGTPPWENTYRGDVLDFPTADPLVPWPRLWRRLRSHLSESVVTPEVDLPALVAKLGRAETIAHFPRRNRSRFPARPRILVDRTRRQMPFWSDQDHVCQALSRWTLRDNHQAFPLVDGDWAPQRLMVGWPEIPPPDARNAVVLLLGDLGAYGGPRARQEWRQAGEWLRGQGAILRALVPCPFWRVDRRLAALWNAIPWDEGERRAVTLEEGERRVRAEALLTLVAPALRIELGLLRAARALLPAGATDSGTEADVLWHPAVIGHSSVALTLDPVRRQELVEKLNGLDSNVHQEFCNLLQKWHERLPPEILNEEKFFLAEGPTGLFADEKKDLQKFFSQVLSAIDYADAQGKLPSGVAAWFRDLENRLTPEQWQDEELGSLFRRAALVVHRHDPHPKLPPGVTSDELKLLTRGQSLPVT